MFSLSSALDRIRQKPEAVRVRYFFTSISLSFAFIVALWAFSLRASIITISGDETAQTAIDNVRDITKDAPASLEQLMKAGEILKERGAELNQAAASLPSTQQTENNATSETQADIPTEPPTETTPATTPPSQSQAAPKTPESNSIENPIHPAPRENIDSKP